MEISLSEYIANSRTKEGILPDGFRLPERTKEDGIAFADGAMDGIIMYHMGHSPLTDKEKKELGKLLDLAGKGAEEEAEEGLQRFCEEHRALTIIDDLQHYIADHTDSLDEGKMYEFAIHLLLDSKDKECVKIGLSILELFNTYENETLADVIRIVGLSDEFTLFSVFCMRDWPEAETELLELAKRVRGWGRIHCIDFIEAENEETKDWLFFNGVDNDVVPAYSAWPVYDKADIEGRLKKETLTEEEVHALLKITDALLDEGPVSGISRMDNPKEFLDRVLKKTEGDYSFDEQEMRTIKEITEWEEEQN